MADMTVKVLGLTSLIKANEQARRQFDPDLKRAMTKGTLIVEGEAKRMANPSARFRRTIHSQVRGMGARIRGIVGTNDKRGRWFEFGTGIYHVPDPHTPWIVRAKNRKALAIPVAAGTSGAGARWAVQDKGPFNYMRMQDTKGRNLFRTPKGGSTFKESKAQGVILRQQVTIKGMKPQPWLWPAWRAKRPEVEEVFRKTLVDINRRLAVAAQQRGGG